MLLVAHADKVLEVFAEDGVLVRLVRMPETHDQREYDEAVEEVLRDVPLPFQDLFWSVDVTPDLYSIRCPTWGEWRYATQRVATAESIDRMARVVTGKEQSPPALPKHNDF